VTLTNVTVDDPELTPTHQSCASLAPGGTCVLTGSHTVTQADVDAGSFVNTATGDSDETGPDTDQVTTPIGQSPALGIAKSSPTTTVTTAGQVVPYDYVITNTGNVTLTNLTLADNNTDNPPVCVPPQPATLAPGNLMNCTAQHTVTLAEFNTGGNLTNIATADSDQTVPVQVTLDIPIVRIFDPPFGTKEFDDTGLPLLRWTMIWINDSNTAPLDAEVHDPIPAGTTYVLGSVSCAAEGTSTTSTCAYDGITDEIVWIGTIGDDLGATDAASAANEVVITFQVTIPDTINTAFNLSTLDADLNDDGVIDPADGEVLVASASAVWVRSALPQVPETGFAPGVVTNLPAQPLEKAYQDLGQVWLEIPALQLRISITGVPIVDGDWDVSWLDREAGWLNGTAFPGYAGNSVITAHVYLPSGLPGPFVNLDKLSWDDKVIVHAFGQQYIYQVRSNQFVQPDNTIATRHEQYPWLTLLTCRGFDDGSGRYNYRVMIRAVLIEVRTDYIH
jgi:LPXTG-site transpeptidase (sortase) family protein